MASSTSPIPPSPAHSYHNRFANANTSHSLNDKPAEQDQGQSGFNFSFRDFNDFDSGAGFGSFAAYQPAPTQQQPEPTQSSSASIQEAEHTSKDVAALEAAVVSQDQGRQSQQYDQRDSFPRGSNDSPARAALPRPPILTDPHRANSEDRPSSLASDVPSQRSGPMSGSDSVRSLNKGHIGNFSRPNVPSGASPAPPSVNGSISQADSQAHTTLDSGMRSLDLNSSQQTDPQTLPTSSSNNTSESPAMPPLRYVQSQQPVISSSAADTSGASATAFAQSEGGDTSLPDQQSSERERPSSFFGMERPLAAVNAAGQNVAIPQDYTSSRVPPPAVTGDDASSAFFGGAADRGADHDQARPREEQNNNGPRPSSFFFQGNGDETTLSAEPSQAAKIAAYHRAETTGQQQSRANSTILSPGASNRSTLAGGTGNAAIRHSASFNHGSTNGRPASIAPSVSTGPLLDHSHLKPGQQAALLSHNKTLELYRQNAKKTNDPDLIYEFAVFMVDASKSMPESPPPPTGTTGAVPPAPGSKEEVIKEATGLLKKIAERGHPDAQYFLADCYANGIGSPKGKQDFDRAYPLFVLAAKHGHPDAAYRAGTCYEKGWGCRRDSGKALQFYRKAASMSHPGAMYRLATAELNGELGLKRSAKEGVKWLKRSAEAATPEFPHALHELALLHERGIDNVLFVDPEYACELLAQAGEMGYAPSAYKLGVNYEYGRMGCPQDAGLSIHMYNIAAQQNHKEACFALTAWYLVGAPSILPQSDTEAYLWAKKAAEQELAKAEYAVGYFTEMGIGTVKDLKESKEWYKRAAEHGDKRANQRLASLGGKPVQTLAGVGTTNGNGGKGGNAAGSDYAALSGSLRTQPTTAPFPSRVEVSGMSPTAAGASTMFPSPLAMRDTQSAQREERYLANVAATQQAQYRASMAANGPPQPQPQSQTPQAPLPRPPSAAPSPNVMQQPPRPFANGQTGSGQSSPRMQPYPTYSSEQSRQMSSPANSSTSWTPQQSNPGPLMSPPSQQGYAPQGPQQYLPQQRPPMPGQGQPGSPHFSSNGAHSSAAAYPTYSAPSPNGPPMRPPPINTAVHGSPHQPGMHPPNALPQSWVPSPQPRSGSGHQQQSPMNFPGQGTAGAGSGGMPFQLGSDDATAAQIFARAQQQQQQQNSAGAGEQPKKKKGWFGKN